MPIVIKMPKLSDTMTEGTLLKWKIRKGDKVEMGEIIAEVETDKATMEMEAFDDGTVQEVFVAEGSKVPVGAKMAVLLAPGETPSEGGVPDEPPAAPVPAAAPPPAATPAAARPAAATVAVAPIAPAAAQGRVKASPLARKLAAGKGVDLATLAGSGPGGRVVAADVVQAPAAGSGAPAPAAGAAVATPAIRPRVGEGDEVQALSTMRRIIAERLVASKLQLPHFYLRLEVNAGPLMSLRKQLNESEAKRTGGRKYTVNDLVLKAVVSALQAVPAANASWNGDSIVRFRHVGLAVAISVDDGLVTPVIKQAETKSLPEISDAVKDLAVRARDRKLRPDEFDGGTITVSNLGAWGIDHFDAIINPPQAAIVSVGAIKDQAVVEQGQVTVGKRMWLGMSCDHRVVDGAVGAAFLGEVAKRIEQPALMLV